MSAYESIKDFIIRGVYKPGQRLTEEHLASELSLSRTPIREAIMRLEAEGLITPLKRGMMVRNYTRAEIRQFYDLRALLEGYAAGQAAIHRSEEDIRRLQEANKPFIWLVENYRQSDFTTNNQIMESNSLYHDAVFSASKNEYIRFLISNVVVVPLVFRSLNWYTLERLQRSITTHETITASIIQRDSERAKTAMLEHVYQGRDLVLQSLEAVDNVSEPET
ncbi:GntR family transcriptional regulator [Paenibacillus xerothermodurans]|uniref:GntR family transcriptional regulator n=1 Tax=Paenibacillus xerothermodurans TaxID=1977292 RepID=A0A2W1NUT0_PAEXE|nr:GntR family transcriptional regulator [Paenibacillus xerothermodurans]PZE22353.1 GntR family transcriptional regulator [Paenibacillus xerothermodurans]